MEGPFSQAIPAAVTRWSLRPAAAATEPTATAAQSAAATAQPAATATQGNFGCEFAGKNIQHEQLLARGSPAPPDEAALGDRASLPAQRRCTQGSIGRSKREIPRETSVLLSVINF